MELEEFIKTTLISIKNGVHSANKELEKNGADRPAYLLMTGEAKEGGSIEFDVAVTATHEKDRGGKASIRIYVAEIGRRVEEKNIQESISRIKFKIKIGVTTG